MGALSVDELKELRTEIVGIIADNPEAIATDPSFDYSAILEIVRTTGRTDLLKIALEKVRQIEDTSLQATAWIEVLDAVENEISLVSLAQEEQTQDNDDKVNQEHSHQEESSEEHYEGNQ